jgi:hypothetical protein
MYRHSLSAALFYESDFTRKNKTIRSQWVWFLTALLYRHPIRPLPPAAQGTHRKPHLEPRNSP